MTKAEFRARYREEWEYLCISNLIDFLDEGEYYEYIDLYDSSEYDEYIWNTIDNWSDDWESLANYLHHQDSCGRNEYAIFLNGDYETIVTDDNDGFIDLCDIIEETLDYYNLWDEDENPDSEPLPAIRTLEIPEETTLELEKLF